MFLQRHVLNEEKSFFDRFKKITFTELFQLMELFIYSGQGALPSIDLECLRIVVSVMQTECN